MNAGTIISHDKMLFITGRLSSLVVVTVERAYEVFGEGRLRTFRTVTVEGTAYLNKVPRDLQRVYL